MKKIYFFPLLLLFMSFSFFLKAQDNMILGNVTDADDGSPLIGVNVIVQGTDVGTITDFNGHYELNAPSDGTLVFTYVGYGEMIVEINGRAVVDMVLGEGIQLGEVVVTALGISREKKALGYAVQEVKGETINKGNEANFVNNLGGKISGVQIQGTNNIGGSSRILIRGATSLLGENQPLFVVDGIPIDNSNYGSGTQAYGSRDDANGNTDYGNAAQDINPADVESVTVLKGANAAALYGSRGANGVILITTKSGKRGEKLKVDVNIGTSFETAYDFPELQNIYGGGRTSEFTIGDDGIPEQTVSTDESWGPKLDGQMVRQWDGVGGGGEVRPWIAHPDNYKNFFETGNTKKVNVALSGGTENSNYRLAYTNHNQKGTLPNSKLNRNTINLNLGTRMGKLSIDTKINYINTQGQGKPATGGSSSNLVYNMVIWSQRQLDIERLKTYENPDGSQHTWRTSGFDETDVRANNPYWLQYKDYQDDNKDRIIGNITATYKFNDRFNIMARVGQDYYEDHRRDRRAIGSRYTPYYITDDISYRQVNADVIGTFNTNLTSDLSFDATVGATILKENTSRIHANTSGGLIVPNVFTIGNSVDPASVRTSLPRKETQSIFGMASFGYKNFLYLDATARNDWSSALPSSSNSYFYPSVTGSLIFSELLDTDLISFGKLRLGWAKVGKDTGPYNIYQNYTQDANIGGNPVFRLPYILNNANLKPEITTSQEIGLEMKFLNNRIALDATLYASSSVNQILPITVSTTTGYSRKVINAGEISNKGIEIGLNFTPLKSDKFIWDIGLNWAQNKNEIVSLPDGMETLLHETFYASGGSRVFLESRIGSPYTSIYATKIATDDNGNNIIREDGTYLPAEEPAFIGSVLPDWTGGLSNSFTFKGFNLDVLLDMQKGGVYFGRGYQTALYAGTLIETAENNIREDGIILEGVQEDGTINTVVLDAKSYSRLKRRTPGDHTVFDASFIKLRQVSLGYALPSSMMNKMPFSEATISIVGRNLAILQRNTPSGYDPESVGTNSGNLQGREYGVLPAIRSIGFNLSFTF